MPSKNYARYVVSSSWQYFGRFNFSVRFLDWFWSTRNGHSCQFRLVDHRDFVCSERAIKTLEMSRARCEVATMLSGLLVANSKEGAEQDEGDRRWSHDVDGEEFLGCHRLHWRRSKWPETA